MTTKQFQQQMAALLAQAPAATLAVPGFTAPAKVARPVSKAPDTAPAPRTWRRAEVKMSKSGRPYVEYVTATKNGGTFTLGVPLDLREHIRSES